MVQVDPRDMLKNFCFHVYAQNSLFIGEIDNALFGTSSTTTPVPLALEYTRSCGVRGLKAYGPHELPLATDLPRWPWSAKITPPPLSVQGHPKSPTYMSMVTHIDPPLCPWSLKRTRTPYVSMVS